MCIAVTARKVLSDCRLALDLLEKEMNPDKWRILWVAAIALIRTVGHVLYKIDGQSPRLKNTAGRFFDHWKKHQGQDAIFTEFIDQERTLILKEYQLRVDMSEGVRILVDSGSDVEPDSELFALGENLFRPVLDGYREGEDARDVYAEAIAWWDKQICEIERLASSER